MRVWVDADACPKQIKEIIYRAAERTQIVFTLVANQFLATPNSPYITTIRVCSGFDVADQKILDSMAKGDLVVTADIPLADAVVNQGGTALDPRGRLYTHHNMKQHLSTRNFNTELRGAGMITGGPAGLGKKEIQLFANNLDKYLASIKKAPSE